MTDPAVSTVLIVGDVATDSIGAEEEDWRDSITLLQPSRRLVWSHGVVRMLEALAWSWSKLVVRRRRGRRSGCRWWCAKVAVRERW